MLFEVLTKPQKKPFYISFESKIKFYSISNGKHLEGIVF